MIERFNVSESLSEITDFSELDCKIDTEKLIVVMNCQYIFIKIY